MLFYEAVALTFRKEFYIMKIRKNVLLVFALSLCILTGCQEKEEKKLSVDAGVVKEEENGADTQNSSDTNVVMLPSEHNPISETNIKSLGDMIEWNSFDEKKMDFKVISVEFSKLFQGESFGDYEKEAIKSMGIETDDKGDIMDNHTYIWMKIQAENKAGKCQWTPMQFPIVGINEDLTLEDDAIYNCYLDGMQDTDNRKDAFFVTFESGEKKEFLLGFVMSDELINEKVGYYISENSDYGTPDNNSFVVRLN